MTLSKQRGRIMAASFSGAGSDNKRESMASSVTRHALIPLEEDTRFLLCGIDTLDLGIYVDWSHMNWASLMSHFHEAKLEAQSTDGYVSVTPSGRNFIVFPSGKRPNYTYHLQFAEYHLFIAVIKEPKYLCFIEFRNSLGSGCSRGCRFSLF